MGAQRALREETLPPGQSGRQSRAEAAWKAQVRWRSWPPRRSGAPLPREGVGIQQEALILLLSNRLRPMSGRGKLRSLGPSLTSTGTAGHSLLPPGKAAPKGGHLQLSTLCKKGRVPPSAATTCRADHAAQAHIPSMLPTHPGTTSLNSHLWLLVASRMQLELPGMALPPGFFTSIPCSHTAPHLVHSHGGGSWAQLMQCPSLNAYLTKTCVLGFRTKATSSESLWSQQGGLPCLGL